MRQLRSPSKNEPQMNNKHNSHHEGPPQPDTITELLYLLQLSQHFLPRFISIPFSRLRLILSFFNIYQLTLSIFPVSLCAPVQYVGRNTK